MDQAQTLIDRLNLTPHPEGGYYRQTWIDDTASGRPTGTCIYFLLEAGQSSHWHKVDAVEIWHFYAGTPLTLRVADTDCGPAHHVKLGPDILNGQVPQVIIPKNHWQAADAANGWALVGCTVSPGFSFDGFVLAPPDFDIPK